MIPCSCGVCGFQKKKSRCTLHSCGIAEKNATGLRSTSWVGPSPAAPGSSHYERLDMVRGRGKLRPSQNRRTVPNLLYPECPNEVTHSLAVCACTYARDVQKLYILDDTYRTPSKAKGHIATLTGTRTKVGTKRQRSPYSAYIYATCATTYLELCPSPYPSLCCL